MKSILGNAAFVVTLVMMNACTSNDSVVDSRGVATSSMSAEIHVSYTGSQVVTIETMLREG